MDFEADDGFVGHRLVCLLRTIGAPSSATPFSRPGDAHPALSANQALFIYPGSSTRSFRALRRMSSAQLRVGSYPHKPCTAHRHGYTKGTEGIRKGIRMPSKILRKGQTAANCPSSFPSGAEHRNSKRRHGIAAAFSIYRDKVPNVRRAHLSVSRSRDA